MGLLLQLLLLLVLVTPPVPVSRLPQEGEDLAGELADDEISYYIAAGNWTPARRCGDLALSIAVGDNNETPCAEDGASGRRQRWQ